MLAQGLNIVTMSFPVTLHSLLSNKGWPIKRTKILEEIWFCFSPIPLIVLQTLWGDPYHPVWIAQESYLVKKHFTYIHLDCLILFRHCYTFNPSIFNVSKEEEILYWTIWSNIPNLKTVTGKSSSPSSSYYIIITLPNSQGWLKSHLSMYSDMNPE